MRVSVHKQSADKKSKQEWFFYLSVDCVGGKLRLDIYRYGERIKPKGRFTNKHIFHNIDKRHNSINLDEIRQDTSWLWAVEEAKKLLKEEIDKLEVID